MLRKKSADPSPQSSHPAPELKNFYISSDMNKDQVLRQTEAARSYFATRPYTPAKRQILSNVLAYAEEKLVPAFLKMKPDASRYGIYTNIVNHADSLNDLHFLMYTIQKLSLISDYNSSLRDPALAIANRNLDILLSPTINKMRGVFLKSLLPAILLSRISYEASASMLFACLVGYAATPAYVKHRLGNSLDLALNTQLTGGTDNTDQIQDGLNNAFAQVDDYANEALQYGLATVRTLFNQAGNVARLGQGQQMQRLGAPNQPAASDSAEEVQEPRVQVLR